MAIRYYPADYVCKVGVVNDRGENLGKIEEVMIDIETGRIIYAVLMMGGFPNRTKYFAVPWELLTFSPHDKKFLLDIPRETLVRSPGYDSRDRVFQSPDTYWLGSIYEYYSRKPEWESKREEERREELTHLEARRNEIRGTHPVAGAAR